LRTELFDYEFKAGFALDIGVLRKSNQDCVVTYPEFGFFAVSDGMGGLPQGGKTAEILSEILPGVVEGIVQELRGKKAGSERYGSILAERIRLVSDNIFDTANISGIGFGATLSCVWLIRNTAIYVNLGDSRGYLLPRYKRCLKQVTDDHNVAGELVRLGEITKEEAHGHVASSRLTRFMGMPAPASPGVFIEPVVPGDRLLLCSDGLHGLIYDYEILKIMRSSESPRKVCGRLIDAANMAGGNDNISAVYIKIEIPE